MTDEKRLAVSFHSNEISIRGKKNGLHVDANPSTLDMIQELNAESMRNVPHECTLSPAVLCRSSSSPANVSFIQMASHSATRFERDFYDIDLVGEGAFGQVYQCRSRADGQKYAVKVQEFQFRPQTYFQAHEVRDVLMKEARLQARLDHENVCRYFNTWVTEEMTPMNKIESRRYQSFSSSEQDIEGSCGDSFGDLDLNETSFGELGFEFETKEAVSDKLPNECDVFKSPSSHTISSTSLCHLPIKSSVCFQFNLYIQMTLYEGDTLQTWIRNRKSVDYDANLNLFKQIVSGLKYIHHEGLCHRDLKPANIFLTEAGIVKIGDFGLAKDIMENKNGAGEQRLKNHNQDIVGSPLYISPETLAGKPCTQASDIYSLGVLLCELFVDFGTQMERHKALLSLRGGLIPGDISGAPQVINAVRLLTNENPLNRPDCNTIEHVIIPALEGCDKQTCRVEPRIHVLTDKQSPTFKQLLPLDRHISRLEALHLLYEKSLKETEYYLTASNSLGSIIPEEIFGKMQKEMGVLKNLSEAKEAALERLRDCLSAKSITSPA